MRKLIGLWLVVLSTSAIVSSGCIGGETALVKGPLIIGSKIDTEGSLLGQMIILTLQQNGFQTVDKTQLGPTSIIRQALLSGEIDIYPEYTGNGAFFFNEPDSPVWKNAQTGYERVKTLDRDRNSIIWLKPAKANNTWGIAVTKDFSDSRNITSLTDFARYVNAGGTVKLIGSQEFVTSPAALPAFAQAYNFTLSQDQLLVVSSGDTAQTEKALAEGTSGVNAAMAYGTDGGLASLGLVFLSDPLDVQPVYQPCPTVRGEVYSRHPEVSMILDPLFDSLDLTTLRTLNAEIAVQGRSAVDVARVYLTQKGFLE